MTGDVFPRSLNSTSTASAAACDKLTSLSFESPSLMAFDVGEEARKQAIRVAVRCCPGRACHPSITSVGKKLFRLQRPKTILKKDVGDFEGIYSERQGGGEIYNQDLSPPEFHLM